MRNQSVTKENPTENPLDRLIRITIFPDKFAAKKKPIRISAREFAEKMGEITRPSKAMLPYWKFATFGDQLSEKGSLRHTANMRKIYGIEADYDGEERSIAWALAKLDDAGIAAIVVATASHRSDAPRYRIFCPASDALEPEDRTTLMARLNGALDGVLAPESFALPQSYYFGRIEGQPAPRVEIIEGMAIDLADHLDADARGKDGRLYKPRDRTTNEVSADPVDLTPQDIERIKSAVDAIPVKVMTEYKSWLTEVGMPLHDAFQGHPDGMAIWDEASQRCDNYDPDLLERKWDSFGRYSGDPVKLGTLFELAMDHGWKGQRRCDDIDIALIDPATWEGIEPPAREWIWDGRIPLGQATYLTGPGSAGKSLLSQQLATSVALGRPMLGIDTQEVTSIYLTCEDDVAELHRRQAAICESMGVSLRSLSGRLHLASLAGGIGNEMATFDAEGRMTVTEAYERVEAAALATGATFIILDNVAHLFAGNENIRNQAAAFVGLMNKLAVTIGGSVLFLGHPNKAGQEYSGSTAWENQVRSRLFLDWGEVDEETRLPVDPDARVLRTGKANYGRKGNAIELRWHNGAFVTDDDLEADESREIADSTDDRIFMRCLDLRVKQQRAVSESKSSRTYAPKTFAGMPEGKAIGVRRLEAAMERLFSEDTIERGVIGRTNGKDLIGLRRMENDNDI